MRARHRLIVNLACIAVFFGSIWNSAWALLPTVSDVSTLKTFEARGLQDDQLYYQIGGATINAFNFNLSMTLTEKVGFPMPVDGGLAIALTATYNSNFYNRRSQGVYALGNLVTCPSTATETVEMIDYLYFPRESALGPGWEFHLGRIYKRQGSGDLWTYVSSEGQEHSLLPVAGATDLFETMDGSRIRARQFPEDQGWEVYLSDGRVLELGQVVRGTPYAQPLVFIPEDPPPAGYHCGFDETRSCTAATINPDCDPGQCQGTTVACWSHADCPAICSGAPKCNPNEPPYTHDLDKIGYHTSRIHTRETLAPGSPAAYVDITYHDAPFDYIIERIRDSHFADDPTGEREIVTTINDYDDQLPSYGHITRASFPSPPDENGQSQPRADFDFDYETDSLIGVDMDYLIRIDYPADYAMTLDYYRTGIDGVGPWGLPPSYNGTPDYGGKLKEIVYPSGKKTELTYNAYERKWREKVYDPVRSTGNSISCACVNKASDVRFVGVKTMRTFPEPGDPGLSYLTSFDAHTVEVADHEDSESPCKTGCYSTSKYWDSVSTMVDPAGNLTEIQYNTSSNPIGDPDPREPADYATFGTAIEERYYVGDPGAGVEPLKRTTREWKQIYSHFCYNASWAVSPVETTTYLDDEPDTEITSTKSDWSCGINPVNGFLAAWALPLPALKG